MSRPTRTPLRMTASYRRCFLATDVKLVRTRNIPASSLPLGLRNSSLFLAGFGATLMGAGPRGAVGFGELATMRTWCRGIWVVVGVLCLVSAASCPSRGQELEHVAF